MTVQESYNIDTFNQLKFMCILHLVSTDTEYAPNQETPKEFYDQIDNGCPECPISKSCILTD